MNLEEKLRNVQKNIPSVDEELKKEIYFKEVVDERSKSNSLSLIKRKNLVMKLCLLLMIVGISVPVVNKIINKDEVITGDISNESDEWTLPSGNNVISFYGCYSTDGFDVFTISLNISSLEKLYISGNDDTLLEIKSPDDVYTGSSVDEVSDLKVIDFDGATGVIYLDLYFPAGTFAKNMTTSAIKDTIDGEETTTVNVTHVTFNCWENDYSANNQKNIGYYILQTSIK